jgi:hypothetical protein
MGDFWGGMDEFGEDPFLDFPDEPGQMRGPTSAAHQPTRAPRSSQPASPAINRVLLILGAALVIGAVVFGAEFCLAALGIGLVFLLFLLVLV